MRILYVEDCEITVELLKTNFDRYSSDVSVSLDIADTVSNAIEKYSANQYGAMMIDWNLPDGNGADVAQYVRRQDPTLPIIFLSAAFTDTQYQAVQIYCPMLCLEKGYGKIYVDKILSYFTS